MKKIIVAVLLLILLGFGACDSNAIDADAAIAKKIDYQGYAMVKLPNGEVASGQYTEGVLYNESNIKIVFEDGSEYHTHPVNVVRYSK